MSLMYPVFKTLHIIGFIITAGVTFSTLLAYNQFWKLYVIRPENGLAAFRSFKILQIAGHIGLGLVLVAGIIMLAVADWAFLKLLWFHIKMTLVILILAVAFTLGRTSTRKLQSFLSKGNINSEQPEVKRLRNRLRTFLIVQLSLYFIIIILSVFRFS